MERFALKDNLGQIIMEPKKIIEHLNFQWNEKIYFTHPWPEADVNPTMGNLRFNHCQTRSP